MRKITGAIAMALPLVLPASCSAHGSSATPTATPATYVVAPRTARPDERAVRLPTAIDGDTACTVIGLTVGMPELVGSHADVQAHGQYVRIRIVMVNNGRTTALVDMMRQVLQTQDGRTYPPDRDAMLIKRQPTSLDLGASMRAEFDLWFDIPRSARLSVLRVHGGATLADMKDVEGADLKLG